MQISTDQLLAEAGRMALELRLKDQVIAGLEARIAELEDRSPPAGDGASDEGA